MRGIIETIPLRGTPRNVLAKSNINRVSYDDHSLIKDSPVIQYHTERPEKCPIVTCEYHTKGFASKHDKHRHTLTHSTGTVMCSFCPSFIQTDVFKRHLVSSHGVEPTPADRRERTEPSSSTKEEAYYYDGPVIGKCSICSEIFINAQEFYEHLDDCGLRVQWWDCSALPSFHSAFHASASSNYQTNAAPSHDSCGYCGDEFPNIPQPDWDCRFEHLTTVHKFDECNAKKFRKAAHFHQHLKYSHAARRGKWMNILENACMKEKNMFEPWDRNSEARSLLVSNTNEETISEQ